MTAGVESVQVRREANGESETKRRRAAANVAKSEVADAADLTASAPRSTRDGLSVGRPDGQNHLIQSKHLAGHSSVVRAAEFSDDGSMLVSGGDGGRILIWNMNQVLNRSQTPTPTILKLAQSNFSTFSLAISADNNRIFVSGRSKDILIYDTHT